MYFKAYLQTQCLFAWHHGKIQINQSRPQKKHCRTKSGSSLATISKCLKVPHSSVQTIVRKYKHHGNTQPSYRSGRRHILSPRDERTLVWKVQINPRTTEKDPVKMLQETGTKVSISTVKWVLYRHNLLKEEATAPKPPQKSQTMVCNCTWGQRSYFLEKCPLVWGNKNRIVWP